VPQLQKCHKTKNVKKKRGRETTKCRTKVGYEEGIREGMKIGGIKRRYTVIKPKKHFQHFKVLKLNISNILIG